MKKIFFLILFLLLFFRAQTSFAFAVPNKPQNFVNDYVNILSAENKNSLENKISNFEKQTTNEIAVVIIQSLDGDTVENVAQNIFTKWGIGKKDKNNGVLLLVSMAEHKTRIHTGYGVEGYLTDIATSYIQSDIMTPAFRNNDYYGGINGAVDKMIEALGGSDIVPQNYSATEPASSHIPWGFIFFCLFIIFQIFAYRARKHKKNFGVFPWWWIGGGGGGGGNSGGGFGGFGGGFSGGGGSSGSW